jgi:DNA-binding SARP family transcriptional activator
VASPEYLLTKATSRAERAEQRLVEVERVLEDLFERDEIVESAYLDLIDALG